MDPLVLLPQDEWPKLQEEFKSYYPFGIPGYHLLRMMTEKPILKEICEFKVYCPYGDVKNGAVAILVKQSLHVVTIREVSKDTNKLEEAISNTKIIDWSKEVELPFVSSNLKSCVDNIIKRVNLDVVHRTKLFTQIYRQDRPPYTGVEKCPPGTYLGAIREEHISRIDEVWPHQYETSQWFFRILLEANLSYGLFSQTDDSLIAWVWICEAGFLTHLYCEQEHRGKGYSQFLVKHVTNEQIKQNNDVFCYIVEANTPSLKLFEKLDYEIPTTCECIVLRSNKHN